MTLSTVFFEDIRDLIVTARDSVVRGINLVQVHTNFEIGRRIIEQEQQGKDRAAYGQEVIRVLADRLSTEFGKGFSASNLAYMRSFYLAYQERTSIFQSATGKLASGNTPQADIDPFLAATTQSLPFTLSWTHYVFLLTIKNEPERRFYELEATTQNWKVRELKRQFDSSLYERLALSRDKNSVRELARKGQLVETARDILKEPLVLEFLGLNEQTSSPTMDAWTFGFQSVGGGLSPTEISRFKCHSRSTNPNSQPTPTYCHAR